MSFIAFDSSFLIAMAEPNVPLGAASGSLAPEEARERFSRLLKELDKSRTQIVLPTPVLAEVLVRRSDQMARLLQAVQRSSRLLIAEFGPAAAAEAADMIRLHLPDRKGRLAHLSRHGVKFDLQILAIAKVQRCGTIYTTDSGLAELARRSKILPISMAQLPSADEPQKSLALPYPPAKSGEQPEGTAT